MSNEVDDDDAFLYGSDEEAASGQIAKKPKLDTNEDQKSSSEDNKDESNEKEGEEEEEGDEDNDEDEDEDDDDEDDEEEDSDSDIEFIIGSEEPKTAATTQEGQQSTPTGAAGTSAAPSASGVAVPEAIDEITDTTQTEAPIKDQASTTTEATITRIPGIDINKVGEHEGKPITSINLQDLKEKPWRQPGADVSEYFNYGFDEFTWTAYCSKQDKLRSDFNPQKIMMSMMPMGMPGMPPMPMMGMPGFQMPPAGSMPPVPSNGQQMPPQMPSQMPNIPQGFPSQIPTGPQGNNNNKNVPSQQSSSEEKSSSMALNPNLPRAPRERSSDPRDRIERENSWGQNDNYRDRERRNRGGRRN